MTDKQKIHELLLAVGYLRAAIERTDGKREMDRQRLRVANAVGVRTLARFGPEVRLAVPDFFEEVRGVPGRLGITDEEVDQLNL